MEAQRYIIALLIVVSCGTRPNYNQGHTHDASQERRMRIVMRQDKRMRKKMERVRGRKKKKKVTHKYS